jgi:hypothetical protein
VKTDPISTSPLAAVAFKIIKFLDGLIGPIEAQLWMQKKNEYLGDITPITAIRERRPSDVIIAAHIVAIEKGSFDLFPGDDP